jgi:uncharacterized membrane protein
MTQDNDQNPQEPTSDSQPESSPPVPPPPESSPPPVTAATSSKVDLPIGELIGESWSIFVDNIGLLLGGFIIIGALNSVTSGVLGGPLFLGYIIVTLKILRKESVEFTNIFDGFKQFLPAFLASLLISIFITIGMILCVVPGIFAIIAYMLTFYYMADKNLDFWPSMEASRQQVMGNFGTWFLLWVAILVLNMLGALLCGLGLFVTGPMSVVILGLAYRRVEGESAAGATVS